MKYKFSCGCEFEQHSETLKTEDGLPSISIDFNNLRDCKRTWELLGTGKTKGIFQLENKLGSEWSEKIEPWNIEDLAALISLIRPGVLKSMLEGKSLAQHYVDRRHKREDVSYIHDSLKKVLEDTYGILCYQEQAMRIAQEIAGFDEKESDNLRKSIGKKDSELMSKIKIQFLEGCEKTNVVTKEIAEEIFGWIQESQKYSFNKCLDPTTIVETPQGYCTLDELQIGDFVNSPDGFIEVLDKIDQGDQDIYEVELESGNIINCTINHKFMCEDGEIRPLYDILEKDLRIVHDSEKEIR